MKKILNRLVSVGATIVIFGAWAKITHRPFGDIALTVGLLTEALIFLIYVFMPEDDDVRIIEREIRIIEKKDDKTEEKVDRIISAFKSI